MRPKALSLSSLSVSMDQDMYEPKRSTIDSIRFGYRDGSRRGSPMATQLDPTPGESESRDDEVELGDEAIDVRFAEHEGRTDLEDVAVGPGRADQDVPIAETVHDSRGHGGHGLLRVEVIDEIDSDVHTGPSDIRRYPGALDHVAESPTNVLAPPPCVLHE